MAETEELSVEELRQRISEMKLKLTDVETDESRYITLKEAEAWDWKDPEIWRVIGGWQITSYESLLGVIARKAEAGAREVRIFEAPRFMALAGG